MAKYRHLQTSFWTDPDVLDWSREDKLFFVFLLTNPLTTQCGIYQINLKQIQHYTGYDEKEIKDLLTRFENVYKKIKYNPGTKEMAIRNWTKFNNSQSPSVQKCIKDELKQVKDRLLIDYVYSIDSLSRDYIETMDTVSIDYPETIDRLSIDSGEKEKEKEKQKEKASSSYEEDTNVLTQIKEIKPKKCEQYDKIKDQGGPFPWYCEQFRRLYCRQDLKFCTKYFNLAQKKAKRDIAKLGLNTKSASNYYQSYLKNNLKYYLYSEDGVIADIRAENKEPPPKKVMDLVKSIIEKGDINLKGEVLTTGEIK